MQEQQAKSSSKTVELRIRRQDQPGATPRWETFRIQWRPNLNVIAVLQELQLKPVLADGKPTTPPAWEAACLEEVCGTCTMLINGVPRQACAALIDQLQQPIRLEPLSKFPLVRDLVVDRQRMFDHLKHVRAWIEIDGTHELGPGPRYSNDLAQTRYKLSECMTCGCCVESCPQYGPHSKFIGPSAVNQVRLFNLHPTGEMNAHERLEAVMGDGGIADCADAQNCVKVCPKKIPLTESIAKISRATTVHALKQIFD